MREITLCTMVAVVFTVGTASVATAQGRPEATATSEASRLGAEYFVQRAGASWTYALAADSKKAKEKENKRGKITISSFVDWKASVSVSMGKWQGGTTWRVKEGAWLERSGLRSDHETIVLPAQMTRGTRWQAPSSMERGPGKVSAYEVVALEAQVELPTGMTVEHCLAVLESAPEGGEGFTHYYAPNIGKVAVQGPEGWLYRLVEFRSGAKGHAE
ncbi:MAG: hypothetical protein JNM17_27880 [Archangium sp.]|nr:hypothetical protein [Archangium sp.]